MAIVAMITSLVLMACGNEPTQTSIVQSITATSTKTAPATFTTMPSPTRFQSLTPAPTHTPTATATNKVYSTLEPIMVPGKIKENVEVREKANAGKALGELKAGSEVVIIDGITLCEGCPLWDKVYYPLRQTEKTGWIPSSAVQYLEDGPTMPTSTPSAASTPLPNYVQPAPRCFVLVYDDYVWRVVANDLTSCKNEMIQVQGDPVFDAVNTIEGTKITTAEENKFSGKYPLGQTIYVKNAGINIAYADSYVYFQGLVLLEQSSVKVNDAKDELSFSVVTKWGSAHGTINRDGTIEIESQAGSVPTATTTPTVAPTKVLTRIPPTKTPVVITIQNEKHTFDFSIVVETHAVSNPAENPTQLDFLNMGRLVEPLFQHVTQQGVWYLVLYLDETNTRYLGVGWIPANSLDKKPTNIRSIPPPPSK